MTAPGARVDRRAPLPAVRGGARVRAPASVALALALLGGGCTDLGPAPTITDMRPNVAYSDVTLPVLVDAPLLRQALVVDLSGETATYQPGTISMSLVGEEPGLPGSVPLGDVAEVQEPTFLTSIPPGVPAGMYGLRVVPPDGHPVILHAAFQELGPDATPPVVTVGMPMDGDTLGAGTTVTASINVDDGIGGLEAVHWSTSDDSFGDCVLTPQPVTGAAPTSTTCQPQPQFTVMPIADGAGPTVPYAFTVVAIAVSKQMTTLTVPLFEANVPVVDSFENAFGSLDGHQAFTVHGHYFPKGAQAFIGGVAITGNAPAYLPGGDVMDDGTIVGFTPPNNRPMAAPVEVRAPAGVGRANDSFQYISPPRVRSIVPATSPTAGGAFVTVAGNDLLSGVQIMFGDSLDDGQPMTGCTYTADDKVTGYVPPGQGTVSVWAVHPITGTGPALVAAFTYSDPVADGGVTPEPEGVTAARK